MQSDLGSARVPRCCARRLVEHLERSIVFTFQLSLPNVRASRRDADWNTRDGCAPHEAPGVPFQIIGGWLNLRPVLVSLGVLGVSAVKRGFGRLMGGTREKRGVVLEDMIDDGGKGVSFCSGVRLGGYFSFSQSEFFFLHADAPVVNIVGAMPLEEEEKVFERIEIFLVGSGEGELKGLALEEVKGGGAEVCLGGRGEAVDFAGCI